MATAKELGVDATADKPPADNWFVDVPNGNFQAAFHWTDGGATPYDMYSDIFDGAQYVPVGQKANWNFGRYQNDDATAAFKTYASSSSEDDRTAALNKIQQIFVDDVPGIALWSRPQHGAVLDEELRRLAGRGQPVRRAAADPSERCRDRHEAQARQLSRR